MIKNWKLALGLGAGFWGIMFIGVSALMVSGLPDLVQEIGEIILAGVAGFILAKIYFKKNPGDIKTGVIIWLVWLIVGTILDLLVTIQYVKAGASYLTGLKIFYGTWSLWVSFVLLLAGVVLAVRTTHGGALMTKPPVQPLNQKPPSQPMA